MTIIFKVILVIFCNGLTRSYALRLMPLDIIADKYIGSGNGLVSPGNKTLVELTTMATFYDAIMLH